MFMPMKTEHGLLILVAAVALACASTASAVTYYSATGGSPNGNWDHTSTWSTSDNGSGPAGPPTSSDAVVINRGKTVTVNVANAACASLQLGGTTSGSGAGTVTFNSGSQLTVSGVVTIGGGTGGSGSINMASGGTLIANSFTVTTAGTWTPGSGTVQLAANNTLPTSFLISFNNLTISAGTTTLVNKNTTISGNLLVSSGAGFTVGIGITVSGTTTVAGTLTISAATGNKNFNGDVTVTGTWTESVDEDFSFGGSLQNDGTFNANVGDHNFFGVSKTLSGANAIFIPTAIFSGPGASYDNNATLTVGTLLRVISPAILYNNGTITATTALSGTGTLLQNAGSALNIGGSSDISTLKATGNGNTVNYTAAAQTVKATTYYNLIFSGSGAKSMASGTTVSGNLSIAPTGSAKASVGADLTLNVASLTLGGVLQTLHGTYGGTGSGATYVNPTYFAATTGKLNILNVSPVAVADTVTRGAGASLKIPITSLLANDTDGNLDTISLTSVDATSTGGATVSANSTHVFYVPNSDGNGDTFNYYISDSNGGTANGTVTVNVAPAYGVLEIQHDGGGSVALSFWGIPGYKYYIQRKCGSGGTFTDLTGPITTPSDGLMQCTDNPGLGCDPALYRMRSE